MSLIIDDDNVELSKKYIVSQCQTLDEVIDSYVDILERVFTNGIPKGKTAEGLKEFSFQVRSKINSNSVTPYQLESQAERFCNNFITRIDEADKDLYKK